MKKKKKSKWKIIGFTFLGILILAIAGFGYEYYQIQPKNHFKTVPVIGSGKSDGKDSPETVEVKDPIFNLLLIGSDARKGEKIGHSDSMMLSVFPVIYVFI